MKVIWLRMGTFQLYTQLPPFILMAYENRKEKPEKYILHIQKLKFSFPYLSVVILLECIVSQRKTMFISAYFPFSACNSSSNLFSQMS